MSWHDRDAQQLFKFADSWSKREEQRRTWWTIFVLDRFISMDTSGLPFAAPEPCPDELLPVNDEDWVLGKTVPSEPLYTACFSSITTLGSFARTCQAAHMLGKVITHKHLKTKSSHDILHVVQEAQSLNRALNSLQISIEEQSLSNASSSSASSLACASAICISAQALLYGAYGCPDAPGITSRERLTHETELQSISVQGLRALEVSENGTAKSLTDVHSLLAEAKLLCQYSLPLIATYLLQYSFTVITTIVAGRLGAEELAASSLGLTTINIIGFTIFEGMATALDTLCAQAYGSGRYTGVGMHIQRMIVFMSIVMIPVGAIWLCSHWILPLLVPQRSLALKAASFLRVSLVGLPGYAFFEAGKRFLQAQGEFAPGMVILIICAPVNAFLSWYFAVKLDMGLDGAAFGQALANNLRPALLLLYVAFIGKKSHRCWGGWDSRAAFAFREWGPMVRLSVASTAVNLAEWLAFEILMVSTSYLGTRHLAAQTVLNTLSIVTWHIPFSISVAVTTRFGHLVGAGALKEARRAAILYTGVFTVVGILDGAFLYVLRNPLADMFSDDSTVRDLATGSMVAVACFQVIDSIICGTNGVLRGLAKQSVAAWVVLAVNYLAAVPFAIWLELGSPDLKLDGLWIGLGSGMVIIAIIECVYMKWISWQDCVNDVKEREDDGT
ncbi:hypothetical protein AU210_009711 [Fusarium oxysporum f. sp. radicis-cucumerinum]|uniref:Uncharacterized protein n=1 Tax=Fusarium oxysporum f. sp. radicis-cucumerinum TaxID=327505 RepID=A0A2H3GTU0_FUSOX|nr:hypothetical protein AU210_009711 [Fusarium oxysporum f. sp. radicis-cucumerinum]